MNHSENPIKQSKKLLQKNDIIIATVTDAMGDPVIDEIQGLAGYDDYSVTMRQPVVLRGMDSVELRVLEVDENNKTIKVAFHAMAKFNPMVSTPRAIYVTYQSMQNTVGQIFRKLF